MSCALPTSTRRVAWNADWPPSWTASSPAHSAKARGAICADHGNRASRNWGPSFRSRLRQYFETGLAVAQDTCARTYGKPFEHLSPADSDTFLRDMQSGKHADRSVSLASWFNDVVYPLFVQACFADPLYGGNNDKVFWTLVGYPGLPATHMLDMVRYRGKPYPGAKNPKSIVDFS